MFIGNVFITWRGIGAFLTLRWLTVRQAITLGIKTDSFIALGPVVVLDGGMIVDAFRAIEAREQPFGSINVVCAMTAIAVAIFRPRLRKD